MIEALLWLYNGEHWLLQRVNSCTDSFQYIEFFVLHYIEFLPRRVLATSQY